MMKNRTYHEQFKIDVDTQLKSKLQELPIFAAAYFRGIEPTTSARTRLAYAYDMCVFFTYISNETGLGEDLPVRDYPIGILEKVTPTIIQDYLDYLKYYVNENDEERTNSERGLSRKLGSLKSFYRYYYEMEKIVYNPAAIVKMPKIHDKEIIRFDQDEMLQFLQIVESGQNLTKKQRMYHEKNKNRDMALLTLLLGTGIRVSECVGLDLNDVDFKNHGIRIVRKGGNQVVIYFGDVVEQALLHYINERNAVIPCSGHENALFLSLQKKRLSVHAVEQTVKKYAEQVTHLKKITPHKLRSTYGTQLYEKTGDIYLVADVLGHADVNTTKKHYAALEDSRRRSARNIVKLI